MTSEPSNGDQPVSSAEFTRVMTALAKDLRQIRETMVTKDDLAASQESLRTELKGDMKELEERLDHEFKAAVEIITEETTGAHKDALATLRDKDQDHEKRITVLERQAGMRP